MIRKSILLVASILLLISSKQEYSFIDENAPRENFYDNSVVVGESNSQVIFTSCMSVIKEKKFCVDFQVKGFGYAYQSHKEIRYDENLLAYSEIKLDTTYGSRKLSSDKFNIALRDGEVIIDWTIEDIPVAGFTFEDEPTLQDSITFFSICFHPKKSGIVQLDMNNSWVKFSRFSSSKFYYSYDLCPIIIREHPIKSSHVDSLALVKLYENTNGRTWKTTWNLNNPVDLWNGVTLDENGFVIAISLENNRLSGSLPIEIGNLINLKELSLDNNSIEGTIPPEIWNLSKLETLSLFLNNLEGNISEEISNLRKLKKLDLAANKLEGNIPSGIGKLTNLTKLWLDSNILTGRIPPEIGDLSKLVSLRLDANKLSGNIPSEIGNLSRLETLYLFINNLSGNIPLEIGNLHNLYLLDARNNNISGDLPSEVEGLFNLSVLNLANNSLSRVPDEINSLNIGALVLNDNKINLLPRIFLRIPNLNIKRNQLTFDDLLNQELSSISFNPQLSTFPDSTIVINRCSIPEINLRIDEEVQSNNYEWSKDGSFLFNTSSNKFSLDSIFSNFSDFQGLYTCKVTNPLIPGLILNTGGIEIVIDENFVPDTTYVARDLCLGESIIVEGNYFDCSKPLNTFVVTDPITSCPTIYSVQLNCKDCQSSNNQTIPSAFTPNGDSFNETFLIPSILENPNIPNSLTIYNQKGQQVFSKENYQNEWRGTDMTGGYLPVGTYYYSFQFGNEQPQKGLITIIR